MNEQRDSAWPRRDIEMALFDADCGDTDYGDLADAVIAHLWQRADDPEVVEAVAMVATDMLRETGRMDLVGCIVTATLKTLLGPRPTEQEAE